MTEPGAITARAALAFVLATWPRRILLSLVLLIPVVVAALGGLAAADPPPSQVKPGVVTDTGAYAVVLGSYFVSELVDAGSLEDDERWVGVVVELTNQGTEPISLTFGDPTFALPADLVGEDQRTPYEVLRLDNGRRLGAAQPGVTYEVALLWRTTGLQEPTEELELTLQETAWTQWNIEAGLHTWRATPRTFTVALPLGEAPEVILEEEDE